MVDKTIFGLNRSVENARVGDSTDMLGAEWAAKLEETAFILKEIRSRQKTSDKHLDSLDKNLDRVDGLSKTTFELFSGLNDRMTKLVGSVIQNTKILCLYRKLTSE